LKEEYGDSVVSRFLEGWLMGQRIKMVVAVLLIVFLGFILGVAANLIYSYILPILSDLFPQLVSSEWFLWGLIGSLLAIICCLVYAYLP